MAQDELEKRSPSAEIKSRHSNRYPLSGKIQCGCCGNRFVARSKKRKDGSRYKAWRCYEAVQHGAAKVDSAGNHIGCDVTAQIRDEDFMLVIQKVIENLKINKKVILEDVIDILKIVFSTGEEKHFNEETIKKKIEHMTLKSERLLDLYLSEDLTKEQYRKKKENYEKEISELNKALENISKKSHCSYDCDKAISEVKEYLSDLLYGKKQDDVFYKTIIGKIIVYDRKHFDVYLNLLPHKWSVVLNSALKQADLCGRISGTTCQYR